MRKYYAFKECENQGLHQSAYFLRRDLSFRRDREPRLKVELESVQEPAKTFTFSTDIWLPKNWIIEEQVGTKNKMGSSHWNYDIFHCLILLLLDQLFKYLFASVRTADGVSSHASYIYFENTLFKK